MLNDYNEEKIMCFYIIINDDSTEYFGIGRFERDGGSYKMSNDNKYMCALRGISRVLEIV